MSDLKAREGHCAGALALSSKLTEVIGFDGPNSIAATTVLRFGEYTILLLFFTYSHMLCDRNFENSYVISRGSRLIFLVFTIFFAQHEV